MIKNWLTTVLFVITIHKANVQFPMPWGYPPYIPRPPIVVAIPPIAIQLPNNEEASTTSTTTTTTTQRPIGIAIPALPIAVPYPVAPVAIPALPPPLPCQVRPRPPQCPPCPPCICIPCVPAFFAFCSPCHQRCRCREGQNPPIPLPPPMPPAIPLPHPIFPGPIVVVPFPPIRPTTPRDTETETETDTDTSESCDASDSSSSRRIRVRHRRRRPARKSGRRQGKRNIKDFQGIKPVLTYANSDGDVKLRRHLTANEAELLLNDGKKLMKNNRKEIKGDDELHDEASFRRKVKQLKNDEHYVVNEGKNEVIFMPDKKRRITNVSLTFNVVKE